MGEDRGMKKHHYLFRDSEIVPELAKIDAKFDKIRLMDAQSCTILCSSSLSYPKKSGICLGCFLDLMFLSRKIQDSTLDLP